MARARSAAPGDFAPLLEEIETLFPKDTAWAIREAAQKWLLGLWIVRDADAAAEYVAEKKDKILASSFGLMLGSLAPEKVAVILNGSLRGALGQYFPSAVLRALAESHPLTLLTMDMAAERDQTRHWTRALTALAGTDPVRAAEIWKSRGIKGTTGREALYSVVGAWQALNPTAARQWVDALEDPEARRLAQHAWLGALAKKDVQAARHELAGMELGDWLPGVPGGMDEAAAQYPQDARMIVLAALARENLPAALAELESWKKEIKPSSKTELENSDPFAVSSDPSENLWRAVLQAAAPALPNDPAPLLTTLRSLAADPSLSSEQRQSMQASLFSMKLSEWSAGTTLEALRMLLPDNDSLAETSRGPLIRRLTAADPDLCVDFFVSLPEKQRREISWDLLNSLRATDIDLALKVAVLVPKDHWSEPMARQLAAAPGEAKRLIEQLPVNDSTGGVRRDFSANWAKSDPEAAAQWIVTLPQDSGASHAAQGLTDTWARYDDAAASEWTANLPHGHARDGAAAGLAMGLAASEPEAAWKWAASISSDGLAATAYREVAAQWGNEAPPGFAAAFTAVLERDHYSPQLKAEALGSLTRTPPAKRNRSEN